MLGDALEAAARAAASQAEQPQRARCVAARARAAYAWLGQQTEAEVAAASSQGNLDDDDPAVQARELLTLDYAEFCRERTRVAVARAFGAEAELTAPSSPAIPADLRDGHAAALAAHVAARRACSPTGASAD